MNPNDKLIVQAKGLMDRCVQAGETPLNFMMNQNTLATVRRELWTDHRGKVSWIRAAWERVTGRGIVPESMNLHGLPIVLGNHMQDGLIGLQTGRLASPKERNKSFEDHFQKRIPSAPADPDAVTNEAIIEGMGMSPTAVLIKAMEGADDVRAIVALRVMKDGSVDMCCNVSKFELQGILHAGMVWAAQRD